MNQRPWVRFPPGAFFFRFNIFLVTFYFLRLIPTSAFNHDETCEIRLTGMRYRVRSRIYEELDSSLSKLEKLERVRMKRGFLFCFYFVRSELFLLITYFQT